MASDTYTHVSNHYTNVASEQTGSQADQVARAFGYTLEQLAAIPLEANLGLSCGNPTAVANLREGETVVDLGSGAGLDVFLASKQVGITGRCIGIDMNDAMLARAQSGADKRGYNNVEFVKGLITAIPLPNATADIVISNCVINLVPEEEKYLVFREALRILKPGGRMAVSDILLEHELPMKVKEDMEAYVDCIAGASMKDLYQRWMSQAGFQEVLFVKTGKDLNIYKESVNERGCCGGKPSAISTTTKDIDLNAYVASYEIYAVKAK